MCSTKQQLILLPKVIANKQVFRLSTELFALEPREEYVFDFKDVKMAFPFSALLLSSIIKQFKRERLDTVSDSGSRPSFVAINIDIDKNNCHGYLGHVGFFKNTGISAGKNPGAALGGDTYVPITVINREEVLSACLGGKHHPGDIIVQKAEEISRVITMSLKPLCQDVYSEFIFKSMAYSIREIIRNSFEHGETETVLICAQYYPSKNIVEIGILDEGVGIRKSLSKKYEVENGVRAISLALKPGVSGKVIDNNPENKWGNSGFGLFTTRKLCTLLPNGIFCLASDNAASTLFLKEKNNSSIRFSGTAVMLKIPVLDDHYFENILESIILEGEEEAQATNPAARASKMSSVLR